MKSIWTRRFGRPVSAVFVAAALALVSEAAGGQPASLVKDIYPGASPQSVFQQHSDLVRSGSLVYFVSEAGGSGMELWKTDGTPGGTGLVADLAADNTFGVTEDLTDVNGTLFFTTRNSGPGQKLWKTDGTVGGTILLVQRPTYGLFFLHKVGALLFFMNGSELWKSDGTLAGTVPIAAVGLPETENSTPAVVGNTLFFTASDSDHGAELWKSDGTPAGTGLVKDIRPGTLGSLPNRLAAFGGGIVFSAYDDDHGWELWKSDGTEAGTVLIKDIVPGVAGSSPAYLTPFNGFLLFTATDGAIGSELWRSDGTSAGTVLVRDIKPGAASSFISLMTPGPGGIYFSADDGVSGLELWKTDGTFSGTVRVADLYAGTGGSFLDRLTFIGGVLYFTAIDPDRGRELFRTDGSEAGTFVVRDVGVSSSMVELQGSFLFLGTDDGSYHFDTLWKSDGTGNGTVSYFSFDVPAGSRPQNITGLNNEAYFLADDGQNGRQVWKTDGTAAGTQQLSWFDPPPAENSVSQLITAGSHVFFCGPGDLWAFAAGATEGALLSSSAFYPNPFQGSLFFMQFNPVSSSIEFWKTDGTPVSTHLFKAFPSTYSFDGGPIVEVGPVGFFIMRQSSNDELWKTDGTPEGTVLVKQLSSYSPSFGAYRMTPFHGFLYFRVEAFPTATIWVSDGTEAGTHTVIPLAGESLTVVNDTLFFAALDATAGMELWRSDGSAGGTSRLKDIRPGTDSSYPAQLVGLGNALYFVADDGVHGAELWRSDGTEAGTTLVADIRDGPESSAIQSLTASGGRLFFSASSPASGAELWTSDGTPGGTVLLIDIHPGAGASSPGSLTDVGGTLYFAALDPLTGRELWKSDGTPAGTVLVRDINRSLNDSAPGSGVESGGLLFFSAVNADNGRELWRSDGTAGGTVLVKDLIPGRFTSFPRIISSYRGKLFLSAEDEGRGFEPWVSDGTEAGTFLLKDIRPGFASSSPAGFIAYAGGVYFNADDGVHGRELWVTDGTPAGTSLFKEIVPGSGGAAFGGGLVSGSYLFFFATAPPGFGGGQALWRTDGTSSGTIPLAGFNAVSGQVSLGATLFFVATTAQGIGLWGSDGTQAGTHLIRLIYTGTSFFPGLIQSSGSLFYFYIQDTSTTNSFELWASDGTSGGTVLAKSGFGPYPQVLTAVDGVLFFVADDRVHGSELWRSDGTPSGTVLLKDIFPGAGGSGIGSLLNVGGKLLFGANDGVHGSELWVSDGTGPGTVLFQDIEPGPASSGPGRALNPYSGLLTIAGTRVFFSATDSDIGTELWSLPMSAVCTPPPAPVIVSSRNPGCGEVTLDAGPGYASYLWSTGETTQTIIVSPVVATAYSVFVGNAIGCRSSSSILQQVDPTPVPAAPTASNNGPICAGETLQLSASTVPGALYSWTGPSGFVSNLQNPVILSAPASASGTYSVRVTVSSCTSHPGVTIATVAPLPSAAIAAPSGVCPGTGGLSASVPSAGAGATYLWSITNGAITGGAGTPSIVFNSGASGAVQIDVTVTDANGCAASGSKSIAVTAGPSCGSGFFTVAPCRVADTRDAPGVSGGPALEANTVRGFPVAGICGIPPTARAVAINLAVFLPSDDGDLRVYPAGGAEPLASSINFRPGIVRANNAIVPLGTDGGIDVQCDMASPTGTTHFFFDVYGYYE